MEEQIRIFIKRTATKSFVKRKIDRTYLNTFNIICNDCDNTLFQEYEDPNAYNKKISMQMIQKIALKNHLRMLAKRLQEVENYKMLFDSMIDNYGFEFDEENYDRNTSFY